MEGFRARVHSGMMAVNDTIMQWTNHELPCGGVGPSGMGKYHGRRSFLTFSNNKGVLEKSPFLDGLPVLKQLLGARFPKQGKYPSWARFVVGLFGSHRIAAVMNAFMPLVL